MTPRWKKMSLSLRQASDVALCYFGRTLHIIKIFFTNPESPKTTCAKSVKPTYIDIKKNQRPKAQQKELEHTSDVRAIQREMLGLMREDVTIKRKFLDAFQGLVQIKKQKSEMHTKTYFEL
ncbi:uncharacterized protein LOC144625392 isoform X2 [Crassostrea virginica]